MEYQDLGHAEKSYCKRGLLSSSIRKTVSWYRYRDALVFIGPGNFDKWLHINLLLVFKEM